MKLRSFIAIAIVFFTKSLVSQTNYGISVVPDTILKVCQNVITKEIGKKAFNSSVKYIKSDLNTTKNANGVTENYTVFYYYTFPNIKESHVVFSFNCYKNQNQIRIVKDSAFKNFTRLPLALKSKPLKVIGFNESRTIAAKTDPAMKANEDKLFGELSTDYDDKVKDYFFVWRFYYMAPCKDCAAGQFTIHSASLDAVSGKVIPNP
jgi:hypothetical protein